MNHEIKRLQESIVLIEKAIENVNLVKKETIWHEDLFTLMEDNLKELNNLKRDCEGRLHDAEYFADVITTKKGFEKAITEFLNKQKND